MKPPSQEKATTRKKGKNLIAALLSGGLHSHMYVLPYEAIEGLKLFA